MWGERGKEETYYKEPDIVYSRYRNLIWDKQSVLSFHDDFREEDKYGREIKKQKNYIFSRIPLYSTLQDSNGILYHPAPPTRWDISTPSSWL